MSTRGITEYLGAEFAEFLSKQIRFTPVADAFGDRTTLGRDYPAANQHEIQKLHVLGWFCAEKNEHRTAKDVYDHIHDPAMYLWIAETVGLDEETVRKAAYEAGGRYLVKDGKRIEVTTQAKIIRDIIPWADIFQKLIRLTTNH